MAPFHDAWGAQDHDAATQALLAMWDNSAAWDDFHGILPRLDRVTCPVDLFEATGSIAVMTTIMDRLAVGMPHAKRHIIKGAGHIVPLTHVDVVALALQDR